MKYQKRCAAFHEEKGRIIDSFLADYGYDKPRYCLPEDIEEIMSWSSKDAKQTFNQLVRYIQYKSAVGLSPVSCIFCLKTDVTCTECGYAKRHGGTCGAPGSDYKEILFKLKMDDIERLDTNVYAGIINKILRS